jgi:hypothetical protein
MTLLDAPVFDEARDRRRRTIIWSAAGLLFVLFVTWWLVAGRPVDWPWNWNNHLLGRATANRFLVAVEKNDLPTAYSIWINDKNWQQHPGQTGTYPFSRFQQDWSPTSSDNEYGVIQTHKIVVARMYGNVLLMAVLINGRKSGALNLDYDPKTHTLNYSPPGEELYLGP